MMKLLHVFRSEPDEVLSTLMEASSESNEVQHFEMYKGDVDYDKLVEMIFENEKVICWW